MTHFLNFHTHIFPFPSEERGIYNLPVQEIPQWGTSRRNWVSVGIHPWYVDTENWQEELERIEKIATRENVKAIGECGLDRLIPLPIDQQLMVFEAQVAIAERIRKPVIIHCVRAFNELLAWKNRYKPKVPLIVHGFNNKWETAQQLLKHDFYFSLGTSLLQADSNAAKILPNLPVSRLFLENDDRPIPVQKVYEAAAERLEMPVSVLQNQIWTNFATVFKR
ncbi:MAG: TatD family hydrolase [Spirosomataceae bacterium]